MVDETDIDGAKDEGAKVANDAAEALAGALKIAFDDSGEGEALDFNAHYSAEARRLVPGSTIEQVVKLVEDSAAVQQCVARDPVTGTKALGYKTNAGVQALPASFFSDYLDRPRFRTGTAHFTALDSLIAHALRFKDADSALFANDDRAAPSLTAVIDYHEAGADADVLPRFGRHRGHFAFPLSDEWKEWSAHDGKPMKMRDFAAFVEERIVDVLQMIPEEDELPEDLQKFIAACGGEQLIASPQKLMELSRGLSVNEDSVVASAVNLASGEGEVVFTSQHKDAYGGKLKVPGLFLLAIPVFRNDAFYRLAARLRYRKTAEGIVFWYDLYRADRVFDDAFKRGCTRAQVETELPLFFGKPE